MAYSDMSYGYNTTPTSLYLDIANLVGLLVIIGMMFFMYLSYTELKTKASDAATAYGKRVPAPAPAPTTTATK